MKTTPFQHQQKDFDRSKDEEKFGVWWEPGLGKSKLVIDTSCHLFLRQRVTGLLVVAPNGVHGNFLTQEVPVHQWDDVPWEGHIYDSGRVGTKRAQRELESLLTKNPDRLAIMVISYDAINTQYGYGYAEKFLKTYECVMVLDESTAISEPMAKRTKKCQSLGKLARYRRVMSGTPVAEGPFKIYTQMKFLDDNYWKRHGLNNYFGFKSFFAVFETRNARQGHSFQHLVRYQNVERLHEMIAEYSSRVLKEDALDLPPKLYSRVEFELETKQRALYDQMRRQIVVEIDAEHEVETTLAIVRMTRLQQLICGFAVAEEKAPVSVDDVVIWRGPEYSVQGTIVDVIEQMVPDSSESGGSLVKTALIAGNRVSIDGPGAEENMEVSVTDPRLIRLVQSKQRTIDLFAPGDNPRMKCLQTVLDPITHKCIIWARFRKDIDMICETLGEAAVRYDGAVGTQDRVIALDRFRTDDTVRYFVANPAAISMGVTLTQAKTVIYYSNTFALEKRLQSEDRAHRIGQDVSVNIIDIVASNTVDEHIVATLRKKFNLAATITGDRLREWLA